ncbi:ATP-binding cassette subfamily C protein LapB [Hasllibacter halocynthiae]|uniref:ATP-binding cassette subfamily C protein LapB n=1 Tax=Hasllibacter halocynthiae TaxID=595589 RepID=A0A2T0X389_9RHOB|nr:type I secretion system permease/ATPase [Hasllibacter halocynthiae]PRY93413.1 ATP-binding cassette subfamily C protein LapB [Hasllibacter halocynthiae]
MNAGHAKPAAATDPAPPGEVGAGEGPAAAEAPPRPPGADWLASVLRIARHYRIGVSPERMRLDLAWAGEADQIRRLARSAGLLVERLPGSAAAFAGVRLPVLATFEGRAVGVIEARTPDGFTVAFGGDGGLATPVDAPTLARTIREAYVLRPAAAARDSRVEDYARPWRPDWLREIVLADLAPYRAVMAASLVTNLLAMAGILFSMQVYDRVVPSQSMPTLHVLFGGVAIAVLLGFSMKVARSRITDAAGRAADLRISDRVFGHALRVRNTARPRATGTFIAQIRELEHVREMMASTTVTAMADLPFFFLFCALFYHIAGGLVWIPIAAMALLIGPGLLAQNKLRRLAEASAREGALRGAMLVEAIQGLDDIKSLQAEARFQDQWNHYTEVTSGASIRLRDLVSRLSSWAQTVQGGVFVLVVYFGAPLVMVGEMSTGVLVAASMLSSRMLAPLTSVTQIVNRWQQARVAREALDRILALPVDLPAGTQRIHRPVIEGRFALKAATFGHAPEAPVLAVPDLRIEPGERIALLGRNGSGKSTLLAGLGGLLEPLSGELRLDDVSMGLLDPADVRRDVGLVRQDARLFHGTLRENLVLGAPLADDAAIMAKLEDLSLAAFVRNLPDGLDHPIQEGGLGLSGGQRQGLLLARMLLRDPRVLLLDEPTAALDEVAENAVIDALRDTPDATLVIATHRPAVLRIVDRLVVLNAGGVALDGPKDEVLDRLRRGRVAA